MSSVEEIVIIVDENNREVGQAPRSQMRSLGLIHRATYIFVFSYSGELFVQKRTPVKDVYPGFYDLAAGGVVIAGESYETSAYREAGEELGISGTSLTEHFDFFYRDKGNQTWGRVFSCIHDGPFVLQVEEVASGEFASLARVQSGAYRPVTPDTELALKRYLEYCGGKLPSRE